MRWGVGKDVYEVTSSYFWGHTLWMGEHWCPAPADKMTEELQGLLGTHHSVLRRECPGKAFSFAETSPALHNTIQQQERSPHAQHPCHTFPPLPSIWCVSTQKHTEAGRNTHLPPPASKNTVMQPGCRWMNLSTGVGVTAMSKALTPL